jgi:hypothetical protein
MTMSETETTTTETETKLMRKNSNGKARHAPNLAAGTEPEAPPDSPLEGDVKPERGRKQPELPGVERKRVKAVERAALAYESIRNERQGLTEQEVKAKAKLIDVLKEHGIPSYKFMDGDEEILVEVKVADAPVETVKVKRKPTGEED